MVPAAVVHKVPAAVHKVLDWDSLLLHIVVGVPAAAARREHNRLPEVLDHKVLGHNPDSKIFRVYSHIIMAVILTWFGG